MVRSSGKRGAIELSMNTIIIVVIGITILTLGLNWIYGIFEDLNERTTTVGKLSEQQIRELFPDPESVIYLASSTPTVKKGKDYQVNPTVIRNTRSEKHKLKYVVEPADGQKIPQGTIRWYMKEFQLESGEAFKDIIIFSTKNLPLGIHSFRVKAICTDCTPVKEQEESVPLTLEVVP
jgi:ABC-type lipoprotein release transport system permease subunit